MGLWLWLWLWLASQKDFLITSKKISQSMFGVKIVDVDVDDLHVDVNVDVEADADVGVDDNICKS